MIYAVLSDLHANVSALERVLEDARTMGAERLLCLGDIVGYGPQPGETLELVRSSGATVLAGNHDDAVSGRINADDFIDLAGDAVKRHREILSAEQLDYLRSLPHVATVGAVRAAHGDFTDPKAFNYVDSETVAKENFQSADFELGFVGHTHEPCLYLTGHSGNVYRLPPQDFYLESGKRYLVNPGSVGYPRANDGQCFSSYLIYDSNERLVRFRFLPFSVSSVMQRGTLGRRHARMLPFILALAGATAIGVGIAGLVVARAPDEIGTIRPQGRPSIPATEATADGVLDLKTIEIPFGHRYLRANVRLAPESPSAQLKVVYFDERGRPLCEEAMVVKTVQKQRRRIPAGAARVDLSLKAVGGQSAPTVLEFSPETEKAIRRVRQASRSD